MIPKLKIQQVPFISREQMREVDRRMVEKYHIDLIQMMENAGGRLARLAWTLIDKKYPDPLVVVLAGKGGNGGGALVAARHLSNMGCTIHVCLNTHPENLSGAPARQLDILRQMGVPVFSDIKNLFYVPTQIIDGLIGYSLMGAPRGRTAELINWTGNCPAPVISLDLPSGLEADSGEKLHPCINARYVMTLALPKTGLKTWLDSDIDRRLYLADIGVPPVLYHDAFGLNVPFIFQSSHIVEIIR